MPRGTYTIEREPRGAPLVPHTGEPREAYARGAMHIRDGVLFISAGPVGALLTHPDDAIGLKQVVGRSFGCCGASRDDGVNRACGCGVGVAALTADCFTVWELHFDPGLAGVV